MAVATGGCSADISRFDLATYGLNDSAASTGSVPTQSVPTQSVPPPTPSAPLAPAPGLAGRIGSENFGVPRSKARAADDKPAYGVEAPGWDYKAPKRAAAATPPALPRDVYGSGTSPGSQRRVAAFAPRGRQGQSGQSSAGVIQVQRGDTLYGLSRRHGVSISGLMSANGLTSPMIHPGQKLVLPGAGSQRALQRRTRNAVRRAAPRASQPTVAAGPGGSYVVKPGDSLYRIARQLGIRTAALRQANADVDPRRMRPGQVLAIPGKSDGLGAARTGKTIAAVKNDIVARPPRVVSTTQPRVINSAASGGRARSGAAARRPAARPAPGRIAALGKPPARSTAGKFRWPVKGKVIASFGPRRDGTHNDGINVSVPQGTLVKAADNGVVAYAGNELKGYGNLILIRHDKNWVTAYAHNDSLSVKRGDKIRRGQVIAKAGKTGTVDRPQLHFELRKGSKPVNPLAYLK